MSISINLSPIFPFPLPFHCQSRTDRRHVAGWKFEENVLWYSVSGILYELTLKISFQTKFVTPTKTAIL